MYKKIATLDGEYKGFKNPSDKTVISLFNKDLKINNLNHVVEDLDTIKKSVKVAKNPRWKWITKNKVYVNMEHTYTRKEYNGATHKTKYIQKCSFLRKNVNSPFYRVYDCENWKKIVVKKYSDNEAKNLKTNGQRADENAANLKMKSLGDIKIPNFQDFKSAALWFHEKLRTSSKKEFEGILYKSLVNDYFVRPGEVKNGIYQFKFKNMLNLHNGYKDNFCKYPKIIDARNGKVSYFDRNIQRMVTISFSNAGGKLKLYSISSSPAPGSVAYSTPKGCGNSSQWANKNKTNVVNNTTTNPDFKVGDYVAVRFSNGTFNGTVKSVRADKLYVDFEKVQDMWVYKRYSKKIEKSNTSTTSSEEFKVGDRVKVEFRGKQFFEGTVKAVDNRNQKIYVDFERIKDMWVWQKFSTKVK